MKLQAEIGEKKHDVEIKRDGERVIAEIDGRKYELNVSEPEPNVYLFKSEGEIHEAFVSGKSTDGLVQVKIGSDEVELNLIDPKRLRSSGADHAHSDGLVEIKTAMPGKVVRIIAAAGTAVQKGEGVIVVEAMKMQNEMKSPKDGVVKEVKVAEGTAVNAGDILVVIE